MDEEKRIQWVGSSYNDIMKFPLSARKESGFQLGRIQNGLEPHDWKPFDDIGPGVKEIRVKDIDGIFCVFYVAKFQEAVYVLHCFQKKTQATSKHDKDLASARYMAVIRQRKETK